MTELKLRRDVTLGPLLPEYAPAMYRWMCDPAVSENLGLRHEPSLERTAQWIENALRNPSLHVYAILLEGRHAGNVVIDSIDSHVETGRLSVYVGEAATRGSGIGLTGMYLAIRQSFLELGLHKIWLTVHARNFPAISTYNRLGFSLEGILRDEFKLGGERLAALYMGLLRPDFERLGVTWHPAAAAGPLSPADRVGP
jgi:RimJ/RimL family protein N-acetyltransferase